jgi:hypothetical protein
MRHSKSHLLSAAACLYHPVERRRSLAGHLLLLLCLALVAADARAFCDALHPVPEFYVGDVASDSACTQNDIQSAIDAATCIYGTKIFITREHTYTTQGLNINDKNITLIGRGDGVNCGPVTIGICDPTIGCPPPPTAPLVSISGKSNAAVFTIGGNSNVSLRYLDINNGGNTGANGGGIGFSGSGSLTLDTTWVRANQAVNGAGVFFNGTGASTSTLNVLAYTQILANTASDSGGGIFVGGNAELDMFAPHTTIDGNTAAGLGGGIAIVGPANANIGSPDDNGLAAIRLNQAAYGGGISITTPDSDAHDSIVKLFTTDPARPVGVVGNTATHTGGGIYLKPTAGTGNYSATFLCAWDFRIEGNIAQEGAAIYSDTDSALLGAVEGGYVLLGVCPYYNGDYPDQLGAVACPDNAVCNRVDGNVASDNSANPTSAILIQTHGTLNATRFSMRNNNVGHVIRLVGDQTSGDLFDCLLAENQSAQELIYGSGNASPLSIGACTLANNSIGTTHVIHTESDLTLTNDIIDQGGTLALAYSGDPAKLAINYVLSNDVTTLPDSAGTGIALGQPDYVDIANSDYHLKPTSLGVDYAPNVGGTDLDRHTRDVDLPSVGDVFGHQDLGAYEVQNLFRECGVQPLDEVYCDGFNH